MLYDVILILYDVILLVLYQCIRYCVVSHSHTSYPKSIIFIIVLHFKFERKNIYYTSNTTRKLEVAIVSFPGCKRIKHFVVYFINCHPLRPTCFLECYRSPLIPWQLVTVTLTMLMAAVYVVTLSTNIVCFLLH